MGVASESQALNYRIRDVFFEQVVPAIGWCISCDDALYTNICIYVNK